MRLECFVNWKRYLVLQMINEKWLDGMFVRRSTIRRAALSFKTSTAEKKCCCLGSVKKA
jgi:hypothetical protein